MLDPTINRFFQSAGVAVINMKLSVGATAPDLSITTVTHQHVALSQLWHDQPIVLAFLRHFGWIFCRAELARLAKLNPQIETRGGKLVVMTLSQPAETAEFCGERAPGVACYSDPTAEGFRLYGLTRGNLLQMFGSEVIGAAVKASTQGHSLGKVTADPWQMPGTFIIDQHGKLRLAYYSKHAGDYPPEHVILQAL